MISSAVSVNSVMACGVIMTIAMSTFSSFKQASKEKSYRSAFASPITSTGLNTAASGGKYSLSLAIVSGRKFVIDSSSRSTASVQMIPGPPALVIIATPFPSGVG